MIEGYSADFGPGACPALTQLECGLKYIHYGMDNIMVWMGIYGPWLLMMNRDLGMNAIRLEGKLQVNEI